MKAPALLLALALTGCASAPTQTLQTDCPGWLRMAAKGQRALVTTRSGERIALVVQRVTPDTLYGIDDDPALPLADIAHLQIIKSDTRVAGETLLFFTAMPLLLDGAGRLVEKGVDAAGRCESPPGK